MSLVYACIAPHGSSIIEELSGAESELFASTRAAMEQLGEKVKSFQPDTIIVLTPHGLRIRGNACIYLSENCRGTLEDNGAFVKADCKIDRVLSELILDSALKRKLSIVGVNYGTASGVYSNIEMDWGTLIPLWYMGARSNQKPEIAVLAPSREVPLEQCMELGKAIAEVAQTSNKKIVLVASADQAHAHDPEGIYGFHPAAKQYDQSIIEIIKNNELHKLLDFDMSFIEDAKPDSLWQMLMLFGAMQIVPMKSEFLSYAAPTYFGMLVAGMNVI